MREPVSVSVRQMSLVFEHSRSKGAARLVLLALADVAADDGEVSAYRRSQSVLARKANISDESVRRALRELEELGEVQVLVRGSGRRRSDYRLIVGPQPEPPQDEGSGPTAGPGQPPQDGGSITPSLDVRDPSPIRDIRSRLRAAGSEPATLGDPEDTWDQGKATGRPAEGAGAAETAAGQAQGTR